MKAAVISSRRLGQNCWSAARFASGCHTCERYDRCNYGERVANGEFDDLRARAAKAKAESERLYEQARQMRGGK